MGDSRHLYRGICRSSARHATARDHVPCWGEELDVRIKRVATVVSGCALLALAVVPSAVAGSQAEPAGLWPTNYSAKQTLADCGRWELDKNGFCFADDARNGLEVGVKFQSSEKVQVTGIRIYRVDSSVLTGSLWGPGRVLLARGKFSQGANNAWQDLTFADPVAITPGMTYVASYFTPKTRYAFRYGYFSNRAPTVGPITALRSVDGDPNGVYCYDDQACGFYPVYGHKDSNYWVTPLWRIPGVDPAPEPTSPTETSNPTATTQSGGTATTDRVAPQLSGFRPPGGAGGIETTANVRATFNESVRRATLTATSVRLIRKGTGQLVSLTLTYDPARRRVVLNPRARLRHDTTYRVVVTTDVRDTAGNRFDNDQTQAGLQRASWSFRTR